MARKANATRRDGAQQIPTFRIDEAQVDRAYEAFSVLRQAACERPGLVENEYFTALQDTAFARFLAVFEAL